MTRVKIMLAVLFLLNFFSFGFAGSLENWKGWQSGKFVRVENGYRVGDKVIKVDISGKEYVFKKAGRDSYTAYDDETGNFMEMKVKKDGLGEIYDYETGEDYQVSFPEFGD